MKGPQLEQAYEEYLKRQSRESHPDGKTDRGGRWYPSEEEAQPCCGRVRSPSRRWPWSLMTHCRTMSHVANLYGVEPQALRTLHNERRERKESQRKGGDQFYKAVRLLPDGRMTSLYQRDGRGLEYRIGETVEDLPRREHNGGIYVYESADEARWLAEVTYKLRPGEYAVLRCRAEGAYCVYGYDREKLAFHRVTPLEVVEP